MAQKENKSGNLYDDDVSPLSKIQPKIQAKIQPKFKPAIQPKLSGTTESTDKLPDDVQAKMETSFGQDFSDVNIHKDSPSAENLGAKAYAQGKDVHFAPGEFQPNDKSGQELIGHELTHVVQQKQGKVDGGDVNGKDMINNDPGLEKEADDAGKLASEGKSVEVRGEGSGVQRKIEDDDDKKDIVKTNTDSGKDKSTTDPATTTDSDTSVTTPVITTSKEKPVTKVKRVVTPAVLQKLTAIAIVEAGQNQQVEQAKEIFWIYYNLYQELGEGAYNRSAAYKGKHTGYMVAMHHLGNPAYDNEIINDKKQKEDKGSDGKIKKIDIPVTMVLKDYVNDPVFRWKVPSKNAVSVYDYTKQSVAHPEENPHENFQNQGNIDDINGISQDAEMWHIARAYLKLQDQGKVSKILVKRIGRGTQTQFLFNLEAIYKYFETQGLKVNYKTQTLLVNKKTGFFGDAVADKFSSLSIVKRSSVKSDVTPVESTSSSITIAPEPAVSEIPMSPVYVTMPDISTEMQFAVGNPGGDLYTTNVINLVADVKLIQQKLHEIGLLSDEDFGNESSIVGEVLFTPSNLNDPKVAISEIERSFMDVYHKIPIGPQVSPEEILNTIAAIKIFQTEVLMNDKADGRVNPGKSTITALQSASVESVAAARAKYKLKKQQEDIANKKKQEEDKKKQLEVENKLKKEQEVVKVYKEVATDIDSVKAIYDNVSGDYEKLGGELRIYALHNPKLVIEMFKYISGYNEDDLAMEIVPKLSDVELKSIDGELLNVLKESLRTGFEFNSEEAQRHRLEAALGLDNETKEPAIENEEKTAANPGSSELFMYDKKKANASYIEAVLNNKSKDKWQLSDLKNDPKMNEIDQRISLSNQIKDLDKRTYNALSIEQGRLTDNFVDCCEFVAEVLWAQGYQTLPAGDCLCQYNWFKENGIVGDDFNEIKVGDIIFWDNVMDGTGKSDSDYKGKKNFDHVGIVTELLDSGEAKFVHASVNKNKKTKVKGESINNFYKTDKKGVNFPGNKDCEQQFIAWARTK